jgi:uncharacterized protein
MADHPSGPASSAASPCVRNCCLDDQDICLGCHRSIAEIVGWSAAGTQERMAILARCQLRARQRQDRTQDGSA